MTPTLMSSATAVGAAATCDPELALPTWEIDARALPLYGPGASAADSIPRTAPRQGALPEEYTSASAEELRERIRRARAELGERVVVLGHFYQRDEIVEHADVVGDSFQLARAATAHPDAEAIVFCGVHFMAETADILTGDHQAVILPNLAAGCSMADMATIEDVEDAWAQLTDVLGAEPDEDGMLPIVPVTYMNSSAAIKAFCGRNGGVVCTSSNAHVVLREVFQRARRVIFLPDQHLGRNTARALGEDLARMPMWNPRSPLGGNDAQAIRDARVVLWHGFCSVHKRFTVAQIEQARREHPGVRIVVHPECPMEVVDAADAVGSTELIRREVEAAPPGAVLGIGTEITLVHRLAAQRPDLTVFCLDPVVCPCSTMYRIHPGYLAWVLERLVAGEVVNRVEVAPSEQADARLALDRMLAAQP